VGELNFLNIQFYERIDKLFAIKEGFRFIFIDNSIFF